MLNMVQVIALIGLGAFIAILGGLAGAFLMWKGIRAVPGERFIGGVPQGQVFTIPDLEEEPEQQEAGIVKERLNQFLEQFKGDK